MQPFSVCTSLHQVEETRKVMAMAYDRQCLEDNTELLEQLMEMRHQVCGGCVYPTSGCAADG